MRRLAGITIAAITIAASAPASQASQPFRAEIESFFVTLETGEADRALDTLLASNAGLKDDAAAIDQIKSRYAAAVQLVGAYKSHAILTERVWADRLAYVYVFVAYERQPMRMEFRYYRPGEKWRLQNFSFDGEVEADLKRIAVEHIGETEGGETDQADHDQRIDYVEFAAKDLAATKTFYGQAFGWEFQDWGPDYVSFADGRLSGGFHQSDEIRSGSSLVVVYSTDIDDTEQRVRALGGQVVREIFEFPGGRRFHFTDPSGNELAVWSDR